MECLARTSLESDLPYWVPREKFLMLFDQEDYEFRHRRRVSLAYLCDWFVRPQGELPHFILPTVQFVNGKTQFINGRHRTAVLINYMECLPLSLAIPFPMPQPEFSEVTKYPLDTGVPLRLPDLKIVSGLV